MSLENHISLNKEKISIKVEHKPTVLKFKTKGHYNLND
jgi:hypothetical protein